MKRLDRHIIVILLLSIFAWAPLVNGYYFFKAHDAPHSIFFLLQFDQAIKDGVWYPRWGIDFALGYGYPLFNMYAPLAYYLAEGFVLLGLGLVGAVKAGYAVSIAASGVAMYLFGKRAFNPLAGLVAGVVYMYLPYHIEDMYVRSAYAESVAFVFLPLVLWSFHGIVTDVVADSGDGAADGRTEATRRGIVFNVVAAGASYAGLILTHNGTALVFTPLLLAYCAWLSLTRGWSVARLWRTCLHMVAAGGLALGLSAIFWLPMLLETKYVQVDQWTSVAFDFTRHFVYFFQFLSPFWGYEYSGEGIKDGMSFQIGLAAVVLAVLATALILRQSCPKAVRSQGIFFILATLLIAFVMTGKSSLLWEIIPAASLVQFPWRLLALTAVTISALSGVAFAAGIGGLVPERVREGALSLGKSSELAGVFPLLIVVILASYSYLSPQYTEVKPENVTPASVINFETFSTSDRVGATAWVTERPKTSPLVEQYKKGEPLTKAVALSSGTQVEMVRHGGASETIRVKSTGSGKVMFYTYFFPGWRAYVDGKPTDIYPTTPQALITLDVPQGEHLVSIRFEDTPVRTVGTAISALTFLLIIGLAISPILRKRWKALRPVASS